MFMLTMCTKWRGVMGTEMEGVMGIGFCEMITLK